MIVDTHVHVFTDDRKKYPQIRDTARAGSIPSITEIGQSEWPLTTVEKLIAIFEHAWGHKVGAPPDYSVLEPLFAFADNPNVYIKTAINNIAAAREGGGTPEQLYAKLVQVFGARRIMWSSNYPAHPKFGGIKERLEESRKALAFLSQTEQDWIFGGTALSLYPSLRA